MLRKSTLTERPLSDPSKSLSFFYVIFYMFQDSGHGLDVHIVTNMDYISNFNLILDDISDNFINNE